MYKLYKNVGIFIYYG